VALFLYQLLQAARSIRRDPRLSAAIVVGLMASTSMWTFTGVHYLRMHVASGDACPTLHQVELPHPTGVPLPDSSGPIRFGARVRVTPAEAEVLSSSGIPAREITTFRSRLVVRGEGRPAEVAYVRFVGGAFFSLFGRAFGRGGPWTTADEAAGAAVAVLGLRAAERLLGGGADSVLVEGRAFRVTGVLAEEQPDRPEWDLSAFGLDQDAVYLPYQAHRALLARPDVPAFQSGAGPSYQDLLASDTVFVSHWVDLPTADAVAKYRAFLEQRFPGRATLRPLARWREEFNTPTGAQFFGALTFLLLLGSGFNMARLLLAKGMARTEELGIYRALGATRAAVFGRHLLEAALLALPAAVLGQLLALPYVAFWNVRVRDTDITLRLTGAGVLLGVLPSVAVGVLAGLYPAWRLSAVKPTLSMARR
jgi:putative ABC transport system permease protein